MNMLERLLNTTLKELAKIILEELVEAQMTHGTLPVPETETETAPEPKKEEKPKRKRTTKKKTEEAPALTDLIVREALQAYSAEHGRDAAIEILQRHAPSVSSLPKEKYAALVADLKA